MRLRFSIAALLLAIAGAAFALEFTQQAPVTVPATGDTTLTTITLRSDVNSSMLCVHVVVATQNLDAFKIFAAAHPDGTAQEFTPSDWTSLTSGGRVREASGNISAIAAGSNGYFCTNVDGWSFVQLRASAAADSALVTLKWSLR